MSVIPGIAKILKIILHSSDCKLLFLIIFNKSISLLLIFVTLCNLKSVIPIPLFKMRKLL